MTGPTLLNRQHSSTANDSSKKGTTRSKYRRCSSADERNFFEIIPNEDQPKEKVSTKVDPISGDDDSGIEDFDQQLVTFVCSQTNNVDEEKEEEEEDEEEECSPCFGACEEEDVAESSASTITQSYSYAEEQDLQPILNALSLSARISHEEKKEFCSDTSEVFHAEFARLISWPVSLYYAGARYHLFVEDGVYGDPCSWPAFAYIKLDNAKAQFKCPNPGCRRLWTSMRARISFKISYPHPQGFVVLKIFGQNCKSCETPADALWYMEEVCRVMDNLSKSIFETFFSSGMNNHYSCGTNMIEPANRYPQRARHDPHQRKGMMHAPHDQTHCEACQHGFCFT